MASAFFTNVRELFSRRFFRYSFAFCGVLLLAGTLLIVVALFPEVQALRVVPLHYNIHIGVDKVGAWWQLFTPLIIGVVLTLVNLVYAARVWTREKVIAYAMTVTALAVNLLVFIHVVFIVLLNVAYA